MFFQPQVKESLIYNIEQNKYSSRKVVLKKELPDDKEKLEQIISSKLFDLEIEIENNDKYCFIDGMDFADVFDENNCETELKQYIEKRAWEAINEKN